jgi:hypothetical protein
MGMRDGRSFVRLVGRVLWIDSGVILASFCALVCSALWCEVRGKRALLKVWLKGERRETVGSSGLSAGHCR